MTRYLSPSGTEYVQAWECTGPEFSGYVYSRETMLDKMQAGCDVLAVTIVRHRNGDREYHKGALAHMVYAHREG